MSPELLRYLNLGMRYFTDLAEENRTCSGAGEVGLWGCAEVKSLLEGALAIC